MYLLVCVHGSLASANYVFKILSTIFWIALQLNGKMYIVTFTTIGEARYTSGVCRQVGELVQNG